ncbi:hypothetical protein N2V14_004134 [Vibrio fluvialis]|nr:hypothetical protein [Vibrio fluvialis]
MSYIIEGIVTIKRKVTIEFPDNQEKVSEDDFVNAYKLGGFCEPDESQVSASDLYEGDDNSTTNFADEFVSLDVWNDEAFQKEFGNKE